MTKKEAAAARAKADREAYYRRCLEMNPGNNRGSHSHTRLSVARGMPNLAGS